MYRDDCFWHDEFEYRESIIHQCELSELGTCPCEYDCWWYISNEGVKVHIYNLQLKAREFSKED